jgi:hypothetical protein
MRRFIRLEASPRRGAAMHGVALRSLDRFEGSPRQQLPYTREQASSRQASGMLRRMAGRLPHQAMTFGFAAETRDTLARK